jgi:hypothetical protein
MFIDNTLQIKQDASKNLALLNIKEGKEQLTYKIGETVDGNGLGFNKGVIIDAYMENGYCRYIVSYKLGRKVFNKTLRQKDIKLSDK